MSNPEKFVPESKEKIPFADQVVVATNFLYPGYKALTEDERQIDDTDSIRGDLALALIEKAIGLGVRVVAADGGSSPDFLSALENYTDKGLTIVEAKIAGRAPQRRCAFETATLFPDSRVIIYTQPEKASLLNYLGEITQPIFEDIADIVIPERNSELFEKSYPSYMRKSELRVNAIYDWMMRRVGLMTNNQSSDWFFGPVVFKNDPEIVALFFKKYSLEDSIRSRIGAIPDPEKHSNGHYFPIIEALFQGKQVMSVEIPFVYPLVQLINETSAEKEAAFRNRREKDAASYLLEALHLVAYLRGDPRSKVAEVSAN